MEVRYVYIQCFVARKKLYSLKYFECNYNNFGLYLATYLLFKHNVPETGFCLRPQVHPTQLSQIDRARINLKMETESSFRNIVYVKHRTMDNVQSCDSYIT
jgi:hypothetical protein